MPREKDILPQTPASVEKQRRSGRSLKLVVLLCVVFGVFLFAIIFFMKPEAERPQIVGQRVRRPIPSIEREQKPAAPQIAGEMEVEEKPVEGGTPGEEELIVSKPPEASIPIPKRELDEKTVLIGRRELPEAQEITQVLVDKSEGGIQVTLMADGKIGDYKSFILKKPPRLVIDVWNVKKEYPKNFIQVDHPLLSRVRVGKHPKKTRFVFDSARPRVPQFEINRAENRLVVSFGQTEGVPLKE